MDDERRVDDLRLQSLMAISQHEASSLQELVEFALEGVVALSGSKLGYIYLYNEDTEEFMPYAWSKNSTIATPATVYPLAQTGIWGDAVRQRRPIVINDFTATHPLQNAYPLGRAPLIRCMTLPVILQQRIVAVVGVANKNDPYTDLDVRQLRLMMDAIWTIAERRKAEQALKENQAVFRRLVDSNIIGIITMDDEKVLVANDIFLAMTGYSRSDLEAGKAAVATHDTPGICRPGNAKGAAAADRRCLHAS